MSEKSELAASRIPSSEKISIEEGIVQNTRTKTNDSGPRLHGYNLLYSHHYPKTMAHPAPLGLCAFALTTFVLSMMNAGAIVDLDAADGVVMGLALFYGGFIQLLAGMWEFTTGNTYGAVAFTSYGGFWMSLAALNMKCFGFLEGYGTDVDNLQKGLGIYLLAWAIFSLFMLIASHRTTLVLVALFSVLTTTFWVLAVGKFCGDNLHWKRAGGILGIITAAIAWYGALAALLTEQNSCFVLPVWEMDAIYRKYGWLSPPSPENDENKAK